MGDPTPRKPGNGFTYRDAGVDIDAGNALVKAISPIIEGTKRPGADGALGGFGGLFDLKAAGFQDPILVAATDGVGTKLNLAIETNSHATVGIDLVAMCVNDLVVQGAEPLFFLDYFATSRLEPEVAERVILGIAEGCQEAGCALIGGETAEMPGMYGDGDYDLAGFAVGAAERGQLLPRGDIVQGDVLLALAASGPHSNGYSLIRRVVSHAQMHWQDAAPFAKDMTLGAALLTPTRIYVPALLHALRKTTAIKALAHITGGGLVDNLPRVLPDNLAAHIDLGCFACPTVFSWLQRAGGISESEMLRTFNCGVGMVAVVAESEVELLRTALSEAGEQTAAIGHVRSRNDQTAVVFSDQLRFD